MVGWKDQKIKTQLTPSTYMCMQTWKYTHTHTLHDIVIKSNTVE